jgi:ribosomal protein S18 acetylase RimI-like enzyme
MSDELIHDRTFRRAVRSDLPAIVALLNDDHLGKQRERLEVPLPASYEDAFTSIDANPDQYLLAAVRSGIVVGYLQLSFLRGLGRQGALHARINDVRVVRSLRSRGLGRQMLEHAIDLARQRGCRLIELTTHKSRTEAHRFYERLGFVAGHEGMTMSVVP